MTEPGDGTGQGPDEQVGSVTDEAAKLFGALSDWARDANAHIATGSAECTWCPVCRTVHAVRQTSPEVRAHLAVAATSLMQAAAGILAAAVPDHTRGGAGRGDAVQHIDLDQDDWPEEDA